MDIVKGHLGCFHILAFVNNATISMGVQISVLVPAFNFLYIDLEVELLYLMVILCFICWNCHNISHSG